MAKYGDISQLETQGIQIAIKFFTTTSRGIIQNPNSDNFKNQHHKESIQVPLLLTWINFNPSMDELLDPL